MAGIIIFDIGASNGVYTKIWSKKYKNCKIYAFEPLKESFEKIINKDNIFKYNLAISDIEGIKSFYKANYINSSSLLKFTDNTKKWKNADPNNILATNKILKVNCVRLDNFIIKNNLDNKIIDFLKIDTQGHDLNVIKSLGPFLKNVKELVCEVQIVDFELYENSSKKKDLLEYMKNNNFSIWKIQKWSHNQEENIWFTNNNFKNFLHLE